MLTLQMASPINLSQSTAKPCDLLCELVMDEGNATNALIFVFDDMFALLNDSTGLGTCKFNGEGYTCKSLAIFHPSLHTIENVQADAEVVAMFRSPTGKDLSVSSLIRINSSQTPSSQFFNTFVGFSSSKTPISLGNDWNLSMMIPPSSEYFVYDGDSIIGSAKPCKWVVFKSMINMDVNDFASLTKSIKQNSYSVQPLGDREVFFNDAPQMQGGPMPMDNRLYIKFKRIGPSTKKPKPVQVAGLKDKKAEVKKPSAISEWASAQIKTNGILGIIDFILLVGAVIFGIWFGYSYGNSGIKGLYLVDKSQSLAKYIRSWFKKDQ